MARRARVVTAGHPHHVARRGNGGARTFFSEGGDGITALAPVRDRIPDFAAFLAGAEDGEAFARLRAAQNIGRPLGDERFMAGLERLTKRRLRPGKRGPKPKEREPSPA